MHCSTPTTNNCKQLTDGLGVGDKKMVDVVGNGAGAIYDRILKGA